MPKSNDRDYVQAGDWFEIVVPATTWLAPILDEQERAGYDYAFHTTYSPWEGEDKVSLVFRRRSP